MKKHSLIIGLLTMMLTACGAAEHAGQQNPAGQQNFTEQTDFAVHYIDVGQADAALVLCDGQSMLIDGGNRDDSDLIYTYLQKLDIDNLDYMVCTHAHEDHVGGLPGALKAAKVNTAYAPVAEYDSKVFRTFKEYLHDQNTGLTIPKAGDTFSLGSAEVTVLGPVQMENVKETNNTSIVLRVEYGETSFLFTGDAEREEEQDILDAGFDLKSTVLKVGHHGGATSTSYPFLREVEPEYAVISVGKGNSYGHPTDEVLSRLRDANAEVYRTDELGDIICSSDGKQVSFRTGKYAGTAGQKQEKEQKKAYVLNTATKKFHNPDCASAVNTKEENKASFTGTRKELLEQGYEPCKKCRP